MFDVMRSRWFYLSEKVLIGMHPVKQIPILVLRNGAVELPECVLQAMVLNKLRFAGELVEEEGCRYYPLKEA
jgi:hypothetical protein